MPSAETMPSVGHRGKTSSNVVQKIQALEHETIDFVKTLTWHQIEAWQQDNEYILSGYRRVQRSWKATLHSVFGYLHNETVNIHSHLWAAILFAGFLLTNDLFVVKTYPGTTWSDSAMFSIFLVSAVFCLSSSSFYHMAQCHSQPVEIRCHALDLSGIVVLIVGSVFPSLHYGFFCDPRLKLGYLTCIATAGAGAAFIVLDPEYSKPTHRGARTTVFILLGLSAIIPLVHALQTRDLVLVKEQMGLEFLVLEGVLYIGGALLYANRVPERFSPGTFDYFFASHQIFHFMVVFAALSHYASLLRAVEFWHGSTSGKCISFESRT